MKTTSDDQFAAGQPGASLLTPIQRRTMLEDIGRIGLALGRALTGCGAGAGAGFETVPASPGDGSEQTATPLERLSLLERLWPEIEIALVALVRRPRAALAARTMSIPLGKARGDIRTVQSIARGPACAAAWSRLANRSFNTIAHEGIAAEPRLAEDRLQPVEAAPVNRLAATLLLEIQHEAQSLALLAEFAADVDGARRARRLECTVRHWSVQPPFCGLICLTAEEQLRLRRGTSSGDAVYRALLANGHRLRQPLHFDWSVIPLLALPALPAWQLYEIWCLLQVIRSLMRRGWLPTGGSGGRSVPKRAPNRPAAVLAAPTARDLLCCTPEGLRLRPATGQASRLRFRRQDATGRTAPLTLTFQPLFPSANRSGCGSDTEDRTVLSAAAEDSREIMAAGYRSLSHDMQPDIALERSGRLYLLDAKYRRYALRNALKEAGSYQALLDDVNKMHTYRDSIVQGSRRAVRCAWCLFPGGKASDPDIIAYPNSTAERPFGSAGIGAVALCPGVEPLMLERLLDHWFAS